MISPEELNSILERIAKRQQTEADIAVLRQLLSSNGRNISQIGKYAVNLRQGQDIQIGDRTYYGTDAESIRQTIKELLQEELRKSPTIANTTQTKSLDELVQEAKKHNSEKIQYLYSKMRLLNRKQIDVDRLYVDVYILEQLTGATCANMSSLLDSFNLENDRLALGRQKKRLPGFEVAKKHDKLMVLGKPGSGKTTFLRHLAIACSKGEFQPKQIPVLIELRSIVNFNQFDLKKLIQQELSISEFDNNNNNEEKNQDTTHQILEAGKLLILLDGLDEVVEQARRDVQLCIQIFSKKYYKNRVVITCRNQVIENNLDRFEYVEIADFSLEQVKNFAYNWFTVLVETLEEGVRLAENFIQELQQPENKQTAELTVTPVLLSLACWVFQDLQEFPQERTDLYRRGVELLLEQWDESRGIKREFSSPIYQRLSIDDKQILLGYIAVSKFQKDQFALFEQDEIQNFIAEHLHISSLESRGVLKSIEAQHGFLVERASQIYSFSHLTFQEYFAARWLCTPSNFISAASDINGQRWREVLSMVFTTSNADRFARNIKAEIDHLLIDTELQLFLIWLKRKAQTVKAYYKLSAVRAFYFVFELEFNQCFDLPRSLDSNFTHDLEHLNSVVRDFALDFSQDLDSMYICTRDFAIVDLELNPDLNFTLDIHVDLANARNITSELHLNCDFVRILNPDENAKWLQKLQNLQDRVHKLSWNNRQLFRQWWKANGQTWMEELQQILIEYRYIKYDDQFSDVQKQRLQQYYEANKLLVYCLKNSKVSPEVRQEIEETLLLPITEIEKHKVKKG